MRTSARTALLSALLLALVLLSVQLSQAAAAVTPPSTYLSTCFSPNPPMSCFAIDGFQQPDLPERTAWVLINESHAAATYSFYLYDQVDGTTIDEIVGGSILTDSVAIYPGLSRPMTPTDHELTGYFTSTVELTLQVVGPTKRCPRADDGHITCAEVRVPAGATEYGFYNYGENPDIVWIHQLYLEGIPQAPYSDVMTGPQIKHYPTGISTVESQAQIAAAAAGVVVPRFKVEAYQYFGGPLPPKFMGWRLNLPLARR